MVSTVAIAFIGVTLGLLYARFTLDETELAGRLPMMYGTLGAVIAVLTVRLLAILRAIVADYFGPD